jgi:hypothetical protein
MVISIKQIKNMATVISDGIITERHRPADGRIIHKGTTAKEDCITRGNPKMWGSSSKKVILESLAKLRREYKENQGMLNFGNSKRY